MYMGNNHSCRVTRVRTIMLNLVDGSQRCLDNIRHVPDLKQKLNSLRVMANEDVPLKVRSQ